MPSTAHAHRKKIFISYSGKSFPRMEQLVARLESRGHPVFIDRLGNHLGDPVSAKIEEELRGSTICLVYYSERYSARHACQSELMHVLVADQREGGLARTLVINPGKTKAHIHPAALKDQIYLPDDGSEAALARIVDEVELRLSQLTGTYPGIDFGALPRMIGRRPGVEPRIRRYGAMWQLHTALHAGRYGLTHPPVNGIAVLTGLPGAGKTALAADYLLHFAHEYALVVHVDLGEATGITKDTALREATAQAQAELGTATGQALVVIDNIPAAVAHDSFTAGFDSPDVLMLLLTEHTEYAALGSEVRLAGLTDDEARELFRGLHPFDRKDETTSRLVDQLLAAVDNHPMAVALLAGSATARLGLTTLTEHVGRVLDGSSDTTARVAELFADQLESPDAYELAVLRLMAACGPSAVPVRLIRDMLAELGLDPSRVPEVLERLRARMLLGADRSLWSMPGLVRQAVRRRHDSATVDWLASACAGYLAGALGAGRETHEPGEWALLVRHARYLVDRPGVPAATVNALLPLIARELREAGQPASAARYLDRLLVAGAAEPSLAVDAASDHYEVGEYQDVERIAVACAPTCPPREGVLLAGLHAAALDAMGRFPDADPPWRHATGPANDGSLAEAERLWIRLLWLRGRRLRGTVKENFAELEEVVAAEARLPGKIVHLAELELAHLRMTIGDQRTARELARRVVDFHGRRAQQHHPIAIDAEYVLATAELRLHFTDLKPSPAQWAAAEEKLRRIARQREEELGMRNVDVLATKVSIDLAVVSQGRPKEVLANTAVLLPVLTGRLTEQHPVVLREYYVQGLAHSQLRRFDDAVRALERAHRGQVAVLGPAHPETLQTQFELAMALKLRNGQGDPRRGNTLLDEVNRLAPSVVGRKTDLPWQAFTGATLARWAPGSVLRWAHRKNHEDKW
ncbi:TIR domain-containing protein [Amycolatopsis sp. lyj-23]|uniref:TIR domain-containing protein n=1 Tax=Amycolatopsis sp. lyj-23 TaxID=2789283 RepID=UPI00397D0BF8